MNRHNLTFRQPGWSHLNSLSNRDRIHEVNSFLKDPNLGIHNLKFKVIKVRKTNNDYIIDIVGSRNAIFGLIRQWSSNQHYMIDGKRKKTSKCFNCKSILTRREICDGLECCVDCFME